MRGPCYWKFNNSLTEDTTYVSKMKDLIGDIVSSFSEDEVGNSEVQNKAIYSGLLKRKSKRKEGKAKTA